MGIKFQKRGRLERLPVHDIYTSYAVSQNSSSLDHLDDSEPIIKDAIEKAEKTRREALDSID